MRFSREFLTVIALVACGFWADAARASVKLVNVNVNRMPSGVAVDLAFDRQVSARSLKPGFERNFVQFVLKSTSIDSARIVAVPDSQVQKVFAYPYNADLARVRVILRQDSHWAKGRISFSNNNPKSVRIFVKDPVVSENKPAVLKEEAVAATGGNPSDLEAQEERKLLVQVAKGEGNIDIHNPDSIKAALNKENGSEDALSGVGNKPGKRENGDEAGTVGIKSEPMRHFGRLIAALFGVLAVFGGGVFLLQRYSSKLKKLPFGKKERLIQVVATHYLGNKKSISLVKVTGEYLVVGVSNEGISLISKLGSEVNVDRYLEDRFWGGTFEKHLGSYARDPKVNKEIEVDDEDPSMGAGAMIAGSAVEVPNLKGYDGRRDLLLKEAQGPHDVAGEVRDRVELSPVRASIKEKLTKLKPLA